MELCDACNLLRIVFRDFITDSVVVYSSDCFNDGILSDASAFHKSINKLMNVKHINQLEYCYQYNNYTIVHVIIKYLVAKHLPSNEYQMNETPHSLYILFHQ